MAGMFKRVLKTSAERLPVLNGGKFSALSSIVNVAGAESKGER